MTPKKARNLLKQYFGKYYNGQTSFVWYYKTLKIICEKFSLPVKHSTFFGDLIGKGIISLVSDGEDGDNPQFVMCVDKNHFRPTTPSDLFALLKRLE